MTFPRTTALLAAVTGMLLVTPPALAADRGETTPIALPSDDVQATATTGGGSIVRTLVGLAIVLAVIYGLYWVLKQVKASREGSTVGTGLESVATVPLSANRSVHLVRAGSEIVLLGVSEHAVVPIRTYSEEEAMAAGLLAIPDVPEAASATTPAKVGTALARRPVTPPSAAVVLRDMLGRIQRRTVRG